MNQALSQPGRFVDVLINPIALQSFHVWKAARGAAALPQLWDFAPHRLPAAVIPWLLLYREQADGELCYGLVGEEMLHMFRFNPKGTRVLDYAEPAERGSRLRVIRHSMETGLPVWYEGPLLFENKGHLPVGRLCLPAATRERAACLMLYFPRMPPPVPRLVIGAPVPFDPSDLTWCTDADLAEGGGADR